MDIKVSDIFIYIINIVVLYLLLRIILYKPVSRFLSDRSKRIADQLEHAGAVEKEAMERKAAYEQRLLGAQSEAKAIGEESAKRAAEAAEALLADTRKQAEQILEAARDRIARERQEALESLQPQIADMALALAAEILRREVSAEDNRQLIDSFFNKAG